jgi:hypothetical protein
MLVKLINKMAEKNFEAAVGMPREEWDKKRPADIVDETLDAIADKKELPEEMKQALKELKGQVPFIFESENLGGETDE